MALGFNLKIGLLVTYHETNMLPLLTSKELKCPHPWSPSNVGVVILRSISNF